MITINGYYFIKISLVSLQFVSLLDSEFVR